MLLTRKLSYLLTICFLALGPGCSSGSSSQEALTGSVGTAGGTIQSADGRLTLEIPTGALSSETTLNVAISQQTADQLVGELWELGPDGLTFDNPVTLTIEYSVVNLDGADPSLLRLGSWKDGQWEDAENISVDPESHKVKGEIDHFSLWGLHNPPQVEAGSGEAWDLVNGQVCRVLEVTRELDLGILLMMRGLEKDFTVAMEDADDLSDEETLWASAGYLKTAESLAELQSELDLLSQYQNNAMGKADMVWAMNQLVNKERIDDYINDKLGDFGEELTGTVDEVAQLMYEYWYYLIEESVNGTQEWDDIRALNCLLKAEVEDDGLGEKPWINKSTAKSNADWMYDEVLSWEPRYIVKLHHDMMSLPTYIVFSKPFIQGKLHSLVEKGAKFYFDTVMETFVSPYNTISGWWGKAEATVETATDAYNGNLYSRSRQKADGLEEEGSFAVLFFVPQDNPGVPIIVAAPQMVDGKLIIPKVPRGNHKVFVYSKGNYPLVADLNLEEEENDFTVSGLKALSGVTNPTFTAQPTQDPTEDLSPPAPSGVSCELGGYVMTHESQRVGASDIHEESTITKGEAEFDFTDGPEAVFQMEYSVEQTLVGKTTDDGELFVYEPASYTLKGVIQWTVQLVEDGDETCWEVTSEIVEEETQLVVTTLHSDGMILPVSETETPAFFGVIFPATQEQVGCGELPLELHWHEDISPDLYPLEGYTDWTVTIEEVE